MVKDASTKRQRSPAATNLLGFNPCSPGGERQSYPL